MIDVSSGAVNYGGTCGKLVDNRGVTLERDVLWFVRLVHLGPIGERAVAVASIAQDRRLDDGEYTIVLGDGRKSRAWLLDDLELSPSGARKLLFVLEDNAMALVR